jgi:hypothetical protein
VRWAVFFLGAVLFVWPWVTAGVINGMSILGAGMVAAALWNAAQSSPQHHARAARQEEANEPAEVA